MLLAAGCNLFNTTDAENIRGRGTSAFDPYQGDKSGAVRLALQNYRGCSILATGEAVANGGAKIPYPEACTTFFDIYGPPGEPSGVMQLRTETAYFLGQFTLMDDIHDWPYEWPTEPTDALAPANWIKKESMLKDLDWGNLSIISDEFREDPNMAYHGVYTRVVRYGNANWMQNLDSSFIVELLDETGTSRSTPVIYSRREFLAENPESGHSAFEWRIGGVGRPLVPGDKVLRRPSEAPPSEWGGPQLSYSTSARFDMVTSANPFESFTVPKGLSGPGAIRVTWSELPNSPFYFPVEFIARDEVDPSCTKPSGEAVACSFGLDPTAVLSTPKNGRFYEPGEDFAVKVHFLDGTGNALHPENELPSYDAYMRGQSNGLLYFNAGAISPFLEQDSMTGVQVAGPVNKFRTPYDVNALPFFVNTFYQPQLVMGIAGFGLFPGLGEAAQSNQVYVKLPESVEPGTYVVMVKGHRQFMGERLSKTGTFMFQVGQEERTDYPNRVGNCQICHRGVLSLDNMRHGMSGDHVESCKTCHNTELVGRLHKMHMLSPRYSVKRNDCTVCHLTAESASRPSLEACGSCHIGLHGNEFFEMQFAPIGEGPNRFSNCAQACHVDSTPTTHLLPPY